MNKEDGVKDIFRSLKLSKKLMIGPAISTILLALLGVFMLTGISRIAQLTLIVLAMCFSFAVNLILAGRMTGALRGAMKTIGEIANGDLRKRIATIEG